MTPPKPQPNWGQWRKRLIYKSLNKPTTPIHLDDKIRRALKETTKNDQHD